MNTKIQQKYLLKTANILRIVLTVVIIILCCINSFSAVYWLAPNGNDNNNGLTVESAWGTPQKAFDSLSAGDTLWVKGGNYIINSTIKLKNYGTKVLRVCVFAVRGEKPVFDCSSMRNYGSEHSGYRGIDIKKDWWHIRGIKIYRAGYNGINIGAEGTIIEGCIIEECGHDGIAISSGAVNTLILNCDSYRNAEIKGKGESGDGFAAKEGIGTVFRGCRAWENVDDGWDVYGGSHPVLIDSCWSFGNGINYWPDMITDFKGDGNAFKLGGGGGVTGNAPNVVLHSFAFNNASKGFDQNHNAWGVTCINCTGYNNKGMGNFAFQEAPSQGKHVMINNLSYGGSGHNIVSGSTEITNSWNLGLSFNNEMFEDLPLADNSNAKYDRDEDYRLTDVRQLNLFKLKSNNPAVDKGTIQTSIDLKPGFAPPYCGTAPDLGASEFVSGEWIHPDPDNPDNPDNPEEPDKPGERPTGTLQVIVDIAPQFTVAKKGGISTVWGPFPLASAEKAVFDMQAVGSSSGAVIIEFSKDNQTWTQVGTQAKNGSTSLFKGKEIDLSADTAPWGKAIYIRFSNNTNNDVKISNLKITGILYDPDSITGMNQISNEDGIITSVQYYNLNGELVNEFYRGVLIKKTQYDNGKLKTEKLLIVY